MLELTGEDYLRFLEGLDKGDLLAEMIKQTLYANEHLNAYTKGEVELDEDVVIRYNSVTMEVLKRMER